MSYGKAIQAEFAKAYARSGNATHALKQVLGEERAGRMQPHTLRAKASGLLNHYRVVAMIEQEQAEMQQQGETLPHYRGRTYRSDLMSGEPIEIKLSPARPWGMRGLFNRMERLKSSPIKPHY